MDKIKAPQLGEVSSIKNDWVTIGNSNFNAYLRGGSGVVDNDYKISQYRSMLDDYQISSTFMQRRTALLSCDITIEPGADDRASKKAAKALEENIKSLDFDMITERMLYAIYYGYSIAEIIWEKSNGLIFIKDIKARRPERFRFGNDGNIYLRNKSTLNGVLMPDKKFWVAVHGAETSDDVYGKGLSQALYWPHIFKSNGLKFWMSFLERFGSPTAIAKMSPGSMSDPNLIHKVQSALEGLAQEGSIITPNTVDIELLQASVGTGVTDYNSLRIAMDDAISKIVIGQTMTTDKGSSYSQSEIHKSVRDEILEADSDLLSESFNRTVSVWFTEYNFEGATPPRLFRLTERKDDILKVVEKDIKIKDLGWNPRDEYIIKTYGDGYEKAHDIVHNEDKKDQQFSEKDLISISRENHERAMDEIEKASLDFGLNYQELIGYRVKEIQDIAEASGDFGLFKQRLSELAQEDPKESIVKKIMSGRIFARLYGMFNAMRKK